TNQYSTSKNLNQQHAVNGKYEWKLDSLNTLKFTTASLRKTNEYRTATKTESLTEEKAIINEGERTNEGETSRLQSDNALQYKRQFKKQGRLLTAQLRFNYIEDNQDFFLRYNNRFYKDNQLDSTDIADQQKRNFGHSNTLGGKISYIEPLGTKYLLVGEYSYNHNAATSDQNTYDRDASGKYEDRNLVYSNYFDMNVENHSGSLMARFKNRKLQFALGNRVSAVKLDLLNRDNNQRTSYHFLNVRPQANFRYNFQQNSGIGFNYNGNTVQPSLQQLQPLRNNLDPLNVVIGNPNLKVGFRNQLSMYTNIYKMLSETNLYLSMNYNFTTNAIVNATNITAGGKKTTFSVNADGVRNFSSYLWFSKGNGQKKVSFRAN
ncbi:MAG TPA: outer membrane beta-barrel protein, partial [Flavisolibacter sp.]|nr:outer membrane beta-barrel protein [Flavisolibacter sp.]